jgi:aspartate carbamoyltransferase catalytic subunit
MQHILTANQFDHDELARLFGRADFFREQDSSIVTRRKTMKLHHGRIMLSMFYEPSTRTRFSFEIAATKLGIAVVGTENAAEFSSAAKGETIEDTVRVLNEYGVDAICMRTKEDGHAARAASVSTAAILNGGDGKAEHPTQAVLDIYTIHKHFGHLDNLRIIMGGDLAHGRTVRSLALLLSTYKNNHIVFVSTPDLRIGQEIKDRLVKSGTTFEEIDDMKKALANADVVYWTRLQLERHKNTSLSLGADTFILDKRALGYLPKDAIIMHPLPRVQEIPPSTDSDPRAHYFQQAGNGLYIRMAMLDAIMKELP